MVMHNGTTNEMKFHILTCCRILERELLICWRNLYSRQSIRLDNSLNQTLQRINDVLEQTIQHIMPINTEYYFHNIIEVYSQAVSTRIGNYRKNEKSNL